MIASGEQHSVREFVEAAAAELDISLRWQGEGLQTQGIDAASGKCLVSVDPRYFRPTEVETLLGDASKARERLGWQPRVGFRELVAEMIAADLAEAQRDELCEREGFQTFQRHE